MPELPEVEVTRRRLLPLLVGRRLARVVASRKSALFLTPPAVLERELVGRTVRALDRHGKMLMARLDDGRTLLVHLGMTGQWISAATDIVRRHRSTEGGDPHAHLILTPTRGTPVVFRDMRRFGKIELLDAGAESPRVARLGPDALGVDAEVLARRARGRRAPVKAFLLDQGVLAGVGNIYADEALFEAGVTPRRPAGRVRRAEWDALARQIRAVLLRSIEAGGSTISDYMQPDGADGGFQHEHQVYGREGAPCPRCGAPIRRRVIAQRSAHFCPACQR